MPQQFLSFFCCCFFNEQSPLILINACERSWSKSIYDFSVNLSWVLDMSLLVVTGKAVVGLSLNLSWDGSNIKKFSVLGQRPDGKVIESTYTNIGAETDG